MKMLFSQASYFDNLKNDIDATSFNNVTYSVILNFYKRFCTYLHRNKTPNDEKCIEVVAECCLRYISFIQNYIDDHAHTTLKQNVVDTLKRCMSVIDEISKLAGAPNGFLICIAQPIFEIVAEPNIKMWFAHELINRFNLAIQGTKQSLRQAFVERNILHICKLADIVCSCGDFMYQSALLEVIFRMCSPDQINRYAGQMFPTTTEFEKGICEIDRTYFDRDSRRFLNTVNDKLKQVLSLKCVQVQLGHTEVSPPTYSGDEESLLWVDFNLGSKTITINCDRNSLMTSPLSLSQNGEDHNFELITVHAENVSEVKMKRMMVKDSSLSAVIFIFKMTHPCSVRYSSSYPVANFPQLKLAATECEAVEELKSSVLTEWFGNRCMDFEQHSQESTDYPLTQNIEDVAVTECRSPEAVSVKSNKSSTSDAMSLKARMKKYETKTPSKVYTRVSKHPEIRNVAKLKELAEYPEYVRLAKEQEEKKLKQKGKSSGGSDTSDENQNQAVHVLETDNKRPQLQYGSTATFILDGSNNVQGNKTRTGPVKENFKSEIELFRDSDNIQSRVIKNKQAKLKKTELSQDSDIFGEEENFIRNNGNVEDKPPVAVSSKQEFFNNEIPFNEKTVESTDIERYFEQDLNVSKETEIISISSSDDSRNTPQPTEAGSSADVFILGELANNNSNKTDTAEMNSDLANLPDSELEKLIKDIRKSGLLENTIFDSEATSTSLSEPFTNNKHKDITEVEESQKENVTEQKQGGSCDIVESSQLDEISKEQSFYQTVEKIKNREKSKQNRSVKRETNKIKEKESLKNGKKQEDSVNIPLEENVKDASVKVKTAPKKKKKQNNSDKPTSSDEFLPRKKSNKKLSKIRGSTRVVNKKKAATGIRKYQNMNKIRIDSFLQAEQNNIKQQQKQTSCELSHDQSTHLSDYSKIICKKRKTNTLDDSNDQTLIIGQNLETNDVGVEMVDGDDNQSLHQSEGSEVLGVKKRLKPLPSYDSCDDEDVLINEQNTSLLSLETTNKLAGDSKNKCSNDCTDELSHVGNVIENKLTERNREAMKSNENEPLSCIKNDISDTIGAKKRKLSQRSAKVDYKCSSGKINEPIRESDKSENKPTETCNKDTINSKNTDEDESLLHQAQATSMPETSNNEANELTNDQSVHHTKYSEIFCKKRKSKPLDGSDNKISILSLKNSCKVLKNDKTTNKTANNKSHEDTDKLIQGKQGVETKLTKICSRKYKKAEKIIQSEPVNTVSDTPDLKRCTSSERYVKSDYKNSSDEKTELPKQSKEHDKSSLNNTNLVKVPVNKSAESYVKKTLEDKTSLQTPKKRNSKDCTSMKHLNRTNVHNSEYFETICKKRKTKPLDSDDNQIVGTKQPSVIKSNELTQPETAVQGSLENICEDNDQLLHQDVCPEIAIINEIPEPNDKGVSVNVQNRLDKLINESKNKIEENTDNSLEKGNKVVNKLTKRCNKNNKKTSKKTQNNTLIDIEDVMTDTTNIIKYKIPRKYIKSDCKYINKNTKECDQSLNKTNLVEKTPENKPAESCDNDQRSNKLSNRKRKSSEQFDAYNKENSTKKSVTDNSKNDIATAIDVEVKEKPKRTIKRHRSRSEIRKLYKLNDSSYFEYTEQNNSEQLIITTVENSDTSDLEIPKSTKPANMGIKERDTQQVAQEEIKNTLITTDRFNNNQFEKEGIEEHSNHLKNIFSKGVRKEKRQLNEKSSRTENQYKFDLLIQSIDKTLNAYSQRISMFHKHPNSRGNKYKGLSKNNRKSRFKAKRKSMQYTNCQTENNRFNESITSIIVLGDDDVEELHETSKAKLSNIIKVQKKMGEELEDLKLRVSKLEHLEKGQDNEILS